MNKCVVCHGAIFISIALALHLCPQTSPVNTLNWGCVEFTNHLRSTGLQLKVVSTRADGQWASSVYLSEDPQASWHSLLRKIRNVECIEQWEGVVVVELVEAGMDASFDLQDWGENGCQIDRFLVFGDARLIEQLLKAFKRPGTMPS